jgi:hypothetical protein
MKTSFKHMTKGGSSLKKKIIVSVILVFGLLVLFTGSVFPFASMGPYTPEGCDSCHGVGKSAAPLPEQLTGAGTNCTNCTNCTYRTKAVNHCFHIHC